MTPESPYCQRWAHGRHSWRHVAEGGFDARAFTVVPLDDAPARQFVARHHYAGTYPASRLAYGLLTTNEQLAVDGTTIDGLHLVGVAVLSVPMSAGVLTNVFPELEPYTESLELGRFVLTDTPANAESWMLGQVWQLAAEAGVRGVVSFADPMARSREVLASLPTGAVVRRQELITPGHVGVIYQATNGTACGRSTPRTLNYLPRHGLVLSERTLSKIRTQDRGAAAAERSLVDLGARPRRAGEQPTRWLHAALSDLDVRKVRHPGNYRYAWPLGRNRRERAQVQLVAARTPYPKAAGGLLDEPAGASPLS
ncbi:hypothetical protein [Nocardioides sp.]|uniref:Mom family adenine methylcarbamoylation protein n=1 Tax=Nocardioides sp. TaxID=35761 RepID=UPI0027323402|nr:hypothetical protein [Nocardioides sp.]MDP3889852.1 hypothetical protein [Nocardioides sp.]